MTSITLVLVSFSSSTSSYMFASPAASGLTSTPSVPPTTPTTVSASTAASAPTLASSCLCFFAAAANFSRCASLYSARARKLSFSFSIITLIRFWFFRWVKVVRYVPTHLIGLIPFRPTKLAVLKLAALSFLTSALRSCLA